VCQHRLPVSFFLIFFPYLLFRMKLLCAAHICFSLWVKYLLHKTWNLFLLLLCIHLIIYLYQYGLKDIFLYCGSALMYGLMDIYFVCWLSFNTTVPQIVPVLTIGTSFSWLLCYFGMLPTVFFLIHLFTCAYIVWVISPSCPHPHCLFFKALPYFLALLNTQALPLIFPVHVSESPISSKDSLPSTAQRLQNLSPEC
jgi:hypothetical protein